MCYIYNKAYNLNYKIYNFQSISLRIKLRFLHFNFYFLGYECWVSYALDIDCCLSGLMNLINLIIFLLLNNQYSYCSSSSDWVSELL